MTEVMLQWHRGGRRRPRPTMRWKPPSNSSVGSQDGDRRGIVLFLLHYGLTLRWFSTAGTRWPPSSPRKGGRYTDTEHHMAG